MFNIGPQELLVILLVALVIVGPQRLPELARTIGRGLRELRKAQDEVTRSIQLGLDEGEPTRPPTPVRPATSGGEGASGSAPGTASGRTEPGSEESVTDVARSLGRGLAEIRRARREIQRTFRLDLADELPAPRHPPERAAAPPTPGPGSPEGLPSPGPPPAGSDASDQDAAERSG